MSPPDMTHHFTKLVHNQAYPATSPASPSLSSRGKTILITGGSQGIGLAIANAFTVAGAANIILIARSPGTLAEAKKALQSINDVTQIHTFTTEITDAHAVKNLFTTVRADPAARLPRDFEVNVIANMSFMTEYLEEKTLTKPKVVLNVSTGAANHIIPNLGSYGASKLAFLHLCIHLQSELQEKNVRIMNFHPGAILTSAARNVGMSEDTMPWDEPELPGSFAVWLASKEAAFLAGRLVYATWDVDELISRSREIIDKELLKIALRGDAAEVPAEKQAQLNGASERISSAFGRT